MPPVRKATKTRRAKLLGYVGGGVMLKVFMESGNTYWIKIVEGVSLVQQAREYGEGVPYITKVEDASGEILWERPEETEH